MNDPAQIQLNNVPTDGITQVKFHPSDPDVLLVSSWDKTVRLYNVDTNTQLHKFESDSAVLDCCFGDDDTIYYGGLDRKVKKIDLRTQQQIVIGKHNGAVSCVCYSSTTKRVYTGSWDKTLRIWDPVQMSEEFKIDLQSKVFSMDLRNDILAIALSDRRTLFYSIKDMSAPWQTRELALRYMLKCIRLMPDGKGFACSSVEGRVAIDYFDMSDESQSQKYAFKSHRQTINDTEVVYPVNALSFHPKYGTFGSGGSDCVVNIWDGKRRKRVRHLPGYPDEIASLGFNCNGSKLAIASSYTFDEGERDHAADSIFVRLMADQEVAPKAIK